VHQEAEGEDAPIKKQKRIARMHVKKAKGRQNLKE
jgi:hypothetical protein